jgi:hypothetical protein
MKYSGTFKSKGFVLNNFDLHWHTDKEHTQWIAINYNYQIKINSTSIRDIEYNIMMEACFKIKYNV